MLKSALSCYGAIRGPTSVRPLLKKSFVTLRTMAECCNDSSPASITVVRPRVAAWASAVVTCVVAMSFAIVYWICPKYFVEDAQPSLLGGAAGAVDVVKHGTPETMIDLLHET